LIPRALAVRVLTQVLSEGKPLDEVLGIVGTDLSGDPRAWLQEVTSGTLRWLRRLEMALDAVCLKKKPSGWLRRVLLLATYQLVVQDRVNPGLVVSETVDLIKEKEGVFPARFANAVLRKIADHAREWREAEGAALPAWLWTKLAKQEGEAWVKAFDSACLERPVLWLRAKNSEWKPDWAQTGPVPLSWRAQGGGALQAKEGFASGDFIVQDISSQTLVSEISSLLSDKWGDSPAQRAEVEVLDLCAAPGGKAIGLAWNGFKVTATDRDPERLQLLQDTLGRTGTILRMVERQTIQERPPFHLVWVDAPCSGMGIIRRHPDVRWLRKEKDLDGLKSIQKQLLQEAWEKVRPGGFLMYSVCSVLREEGLGALEAAGLADKILRQWFLLPQVAPFGDGFFAAVLAKA